MKYIFSLVLVLWSLGHVQAGMIMPTSPAQEESQFQDILQREQKLIADAEKVLFKYVEKYELPQPPKWDGITMPKFYLEGDNRPFIPRIQSKILQSVVEQYMQEHGLSSDGYHVQYSRHRLGEVVPQIQLDALIKKDPNITFHEVERKKEDFQNEFKNYLANSPEAQEEKILDEYYNLMMSYRPWATGDFGGGLIIDEPVPAPQKSEKYQPEKGEIDTRLEEFLKPENLTVPYCHIPAQAKTLLSFWKNSTTTDECAPIHVNIFLQSGTKIYTLTTSREKPSCETGIPVPTLKSVYYIPGNISAVPLVLDKNSELVLTNDLIEKNTSLAGGVDALKLPECRASFRMKK